MSKPVSIRAALRADLPTLLTFDQGIIRAERPYDQTLKADPISYYDIGELIESDEAEVVVAERDGQLIGSGYAQKKRSRHYVSQRTTRISDFCMSTPPIAAKA